MVVNHINQARLDGFVSVGDFYAEKNPSGIADTIDGTYEHAKKGEYMGFHPHVVAKRTKTGRIFGAVFNCKDGTLYLTPNEKGDVKDLLEEAADKEGISRWYMMKAIDVENLFKKPKKGPSQSTLSGIL